MTGLKMHVSPCAFSSKSFDAWAESLSGSGDFPGDHAASAALQFLPWIQSHLWRATIGQDGERRVRATHFGPRTFPDATIYAPNGEIAGVGQRKMHHFGHRKVHHPQGGFNSSPMGQGGKHAKEIERFHLPIYSPDLNPDEYLNGDLKALVRLVMVAQ